MEQCEENKKKNFRRSYRIDYVTVAGKGLFYKENKFSIMNGLSNDEILQLYLGQYKVIINA